MTLLRPNQQHGDQKHGHVDDEGSLKVAHEESWTHKADMFLALQTSVLRLVLLQHSCLVLVHQDLA